MVASFLSGTEAELNAAIAILWMQKCILPESQFRKPLLHWIPQNLLSSIADKRKLPGRQIHFPDDRIQILQQSKKSIANCCFCLNFSLESFTGLHRYITRYPRPIHNPILLDAIAGSISAMLKELSATGAKATSIRGAMLLCFLLSLEVPQNWEIQGGCKIRNLKQ